MTGVIRFLLFVFLMTPLNVYAAAGTSYEDDLFLKAGRLERAGKYTEALKLLKPLELENANLASVDNNIGYLFYKNNNFALAEAYFEKAVSQSPLDTQLIRNRNQALLRLDTAVVTNNWAINTAQYNFFELTNHIFEAGVLGLLMLVLVFILFLSRPYHRRRQFVGHLYIMGAGLLVLIIVISKLMYKNQQISDYVIVTNPHTVVHLGPISTATGVRILPPGYKLKILGNHNGWLEIEDDKNSPGWITESSVIKISAQ